MKPERHEIFERAQGLFKRASVFSRGLLYDVLSAQDEAGKKRRVLVLAGGGILAAIVVLFTLSRLGGEVAAPGAIDTRQVVTAVEVTEHTFQQHVALNGEARPKRDIQVYAPASGIRILEILVDAGDVVRRNQPMARLDASLSQAQTRAAQANVAEARSNAIRARGEYDRALSIRDSGALSAEAIEQRGAAAIAADARLAAARAQLQETNARLGGGYIRAPAAGLVIARTAQLGAPVDGQALFRIAAGGDLEVVSQVAEADVLALAPGQRASFQLVDGSVVEGRLTRAPASIDSRTRTGEALFALPRDSRVRAGMFLRGEALLAPRAALAAPQSSILYENGAAYVFVIESDGRARRADVMLGIRDGDMVEIASGIEPGSSIVGAGAAFVQNGDTLRAISPETPAAAAGAPTNLRGREG